jgi:hypothetical protein
MIDISQVKTVSVLLLQPTAKFLFEWFKFPDFTNEANGFGQNTLACLTINLTRLKNLKCRRLETIKFVSE